MNNSMQLRPLSGHFKEEFITLKGTITSVSVFPFNLLIPKSKKNTVTSKLCTVSTETCWCKDRNNLLSILALALDFNPERKIC